MEFSLAHNAAVLGNCFRNPRSNFHEVVDFRAILGLAGVDSFA